MLRASWRWMLVVVVAGAALLSTASRADAGLFHGWGWGWGWGYRSWCCGPYYSCCYTPCYTSCYYPCYSSCWCGCDPCCCYSVVTYPAATVVPSAPAPAPTPAPAPAPGPTDVPGAPSQTSVPQGRGLLTLAVPEDAKVFINGLQTKSTGTVREYASFGLKPGYSYKYDVRVEVVRDGQTRQESRLVYLTAGVTESLAFDFAAKADTQVAATW